MQIALSNNGDNGRNLGPWYLYANNEPSNSNGTNWGARLSSAKSETASVIEGLLG